MRIFISVSRLESENFFPGKSTVPGEINGSSHEWHCRSFLAAAGAH
jgi:hypothetical protein